MDIPPVLSSIGSNLYSSVEWDLVYATLFLGFATLILGLIALFGPKWSERNLYKANN
jgi:hypothetical protein